MAYFIGDLRQHDMIKWTACFKSSDYCIDFLLENSKNAFENTKVFETGLR